MFLTDQQLRQRLDDFEFEAEHRDLTFDADIQVGPCSVDLRLSVVHWTPRRRRRVLDLSQTHLRELDPHRDWQQRTLRIGDSITLKPGGIVLGRISERFRMPSDCAGWIEGRSSYARLGLAVHVTGGFINPGWSGHMPLTLVNHSPFTMRVPVGTPLCQLLVIALRQPPAADYRARESKYHDDLGGPSLWWRDTIMRELRARISDVAVTSRAYDEIDEVVGELLDRDMLDRLDGYVSRTPGGAYSSGPELLDGFAASEGRRHTLAGLLKSLELGAWTVLLPATGVLWFDGSWRLRVAALALLMLSVLALVVGVRRSLPEFLTPDTLARRRAAVEARRRCSRVPPAGAVD